MPETTTRPRQHTCTGCGATGTGQIMPPGWQWLGSKLLCPPCYQQREVHPHA